jgi:hypothetical protein
MTGQVAPALAIARYGAENATASSVITVSSITTAIEVAAVGGPAVMRWVSTSDTQASVVSAVSGANFDHVIPTGQFRRFVIPVERMPQADTAGSVLGINVAQGLYARVAVKSIGVASVLTSEY